jgi:hypothetical protein
MVTVEYHVPMSSAVRDSLEPFISLLEHVVLPAAVKSREGRISPLQLRHVRDSLIEEQLRLMGRIQHPKIVRYGLLLTCACGIVAAAQLPEPEQLGTLERLRTARRLVRTTYRTFSHFDATAYTP